MSSSSIVDIDLGRITCPIGSQIEIEDLGTETVPIEVNCLLDGIGVVYAFLIRGPVVVNAEFLSRITVLEINQENRLVKVRIAPE